MSPEDLTGDREATGAWNHRQKASERKGWAKAACRPLAGMARVKLREDKSVGQDPVQVGQDGRF